jgi:hypothetical protein
MRLRIYYWLKALGNSFGYELRPWIATLLGDGK